MQNVVKQAFTETSASGTELTIDNTIEARMDLKLKGNTSQQQYSGKNLLNGKYDNTFTKNGITLKHNNDNSFDITGTATSNTTLIPIYSIDQSNLVVGNTYYFYMSEKYDSTNLNVSLVTHTPGLSYWIANKSYTIAENQKFNDITLYIPSGVTMNYHNVKFMIVQGSTATSYEPYVGGVPAPSPSYPQDIKVVTGDNKVTISNADNTKKQEFLINLGDIELCKIGDYQDCFYQSGSKWYLHKEIESGIITKDMLTHHAAYQGIYQYKITPSKAVKYVNNTEIYVKSNYFKGTSQASWWTKDNSITVDFGKIYITTSKYSDIESFNEFIDNNEVFMCYVLNTPTDIEITNTTLINQLDEISQALSKKGTTIISQNNDDLPFNLDVIALTK